MLSMFGGDSAPAPPEEVKAAGLEDSSITKREQMLREGVSVYEVAARSDKNMTSIKKDLGTLGMQAGEAKTEMDRLRDLGIAQQKAIGALTRKLDEVSTDLGAMRQGFEKYSASERSHREELAQDIASRHASNTNVIIEDRMRELERRQEVLVDRAIRRTLGGIGGDLQAACAAAAHAEEPVAPAEAPAGAPCNFTINTLIPPRPLGPSDARRKRDGSQSTT